MCLITQPTIKRRDCRQIIKVYHPLRFFTSCEGINLVILQTLKAWRDLTLKILRHVFGKFLNDESLRNSFGLKSHSKKQLIITEHCSQCYQERHRM